MLLAQIFELLPFEVGERGGKHYLNFKIWCKTDFEFKTKQKLFEASLMKSNVFDKSIYFFVFKTNGNLL